MPAIVSVGVVGMRLFLRTLSPGFPIRSSLILAATGLLLAGCSSSIDRFADYPGKKSEPTRQASYPTAYDSSQDSIESAPLGGSRTASTSPYKPPIYGQPSTYQQSPYQPQSYSQPQAYRKPVVQSSYDEPSYSEPAGEARGGTVTVEPGQTLYSIARANGVAVGTLASVNGIRAPYTVRVGQRLLIPGVDEPRAEAAYAPATQNFSHKQSVHVVRAGETLFSLGRRYGVHPYQIADLNDFDHDISLSIGQRVRIPGAGSERASNGSYAEPESNDMATSDEGDGTYKTDRGYDKEQRRVADDSEATDESTYSDESGGSDVASNETEDTGNADSYIEKQQGGTDLAEPSAPSFRWPVKGRILSRYGAKPGGTRNEGINIAVPEGASIRAAEDGVVAYAGNELKGYGNLVLIRHQGGWVTAYAHNRDLFVRRGDTVRRGDVIAKAGQTGSVESPQLHFELRRGATAVDPLKYLSGSQTASN